MKKHFLSSFLLILCISNYCNAQFALCKDFTRMQARNTFSTSPRTQASDNIDVHFYDCFWNIDPAVRRIGGHVSVHFKTMSAITEVVLDLVDDLTVDSVKHGDDHLPFTHVQNAITIELSVNNNSLDSVTVFYQGVPPNSGLGSFVQRHHSGVPILWSLSEPYGSMDWWPCKNNLGDKADSLRVTFEHPDNFKAASNGILQHEINIGNGKAQTQWLHKYPIETYLVCFAVTNYTVLQHAAQLSAGDLPMVTYCYPEHVNFFQNDIHKILNQLEFFDNILGEYPFMNEKYGHVQFGWSGGMEHQTMSFLGSLDEMLVAHELVHQWFGNKVTCGSWEDIWLNEGFATHFSVVWMEDNYPDRRLPLRNALITNIIRESDGSVKVNDTTDVARVFSDRLSYYKGSYMVYMLRFMLGEDTFFQALHNYLNDPRFAYKHARTPDLIQHFENASGKDLTRFFQQWYEGEGYPSYQLRWSKYGRSGARLELSQTTSHPSVSFYEMPVPILFKNASQQKTVIVDHTFSGQTFVEDLGFQPDSAFIDPEIWLLSAHNTVEEINYQPSGNATVNVYPNPTSGNLNIQLENFESLIASAKIYNTAGQTLMRKNITLINGAELARFNLQHLPAGVYFIEVWNDKQRIIKKIIR